MFLVSACSCLCAMYWSQVLSGEWRCSWSSAERRRSNYIWVINNLIAYQGAAYISDLTVISYTSLPWLRQSVNQEFEPTKDTAYLTLTGELCDVVCEDLGENWLHYNGTALYLIFKTTQHIHNTNIQTTKIWLCVILTSSCVIPKLKCFLSRFAVVFAQSIEARCWVENKDVVGAAPTGSNYIWVILISWPDKVQLILEVWWYV